MELTDEVLIELKSIETNILREFVAICHELNLRYYLLGGTLLGAVRHQGFIPWDDDIDVGMPREDYQFFLREGVNLLPEHLFIQTMHSDPGYINCFAKIRNSNTTFVECSAKKMKINHGVFIDIFPLDFYPDDAREQAKLERKKIWYSRRVNIEFSIPQSRTFWGNLKRFAVKMLIPSLSKALNIREKLYLSVPPSSLVVNHGGAWGKKEIVPADWYGDGVTVMFEGMQLKAPAEYDKWLTQVYGDYMQLPPVEKRIGHHFVDVVDLHKPYTEYTRNRR